ncbi:hypothetical protein H7J88_05825 [Mycolicibacterium flavescens]|uniref:DUF7159 domain-containing protein n=1 Tax=Mycolicibacterium flavescens TaxID=1776 RepID=A0A1E3RAH9_MYCFV|nr:hypothetical protein [Mycolicibacterium flavescens]MCV7279163.1 hypothetical protein [Mycolicibacterium flavescens]ODQ86930.1 hypothetical protein BHQ18_25780 [Mycolicibacterium flavescens]
MDTVLGMSMTSSGIAWVLQQGSGADAVTLDHDHFTVHGDVPTDGDISRHEAAARGARAIAEASGHQVRLIGLTWSNDVEAKATLLLKSLSDMGFDSVSAVPLADAAQQWARRFGRHLGFERCALCVVEPSAVTVVSVLHNSVRTATTKMRESADGIARWLTGVFEVNCAQPESLFLLGTRGDLELVAATVDEALPMPVIASDEAQLTLARGAALAAVAEPEPAAVPAPKTPTTSESRPWARFSTPARAAAVLVAGVSALFAIGVGLAADDAPPAPTETAAETSTVAVHSATSSISVHAVPSVPRTPAVVQQYAAAPVQPETPPAVVVEAAQEAVPAVAAPAVAEPLTAAPVGVSEPAPEAAPLIPPPDVLPAPAPPAPEALPAGPPPAAAPEALPAPLPPPDPIQVVLSPLFGGLP